MTVQTRMNPQGFALERWKPNDRIGAALPKKKSPAEELQTKQQQLQNQLLLLKSTGTDCAGEDLQREVESALEEVTAELKSAKNKAVSAVETDAPARMRRDTYEPGAPRQASFGRYWLERAPETDLATGLETGAQADPEANSETGAKRGYRVCFSPAAGER